ncbi:MAG: DUF4186 family protein [Lachnospiraceae bacterium]
MEHLAIMSEGYIEKICNGTKTIESRFSINKIAPFHKVSKGELVYLKESGKDIRAVFEVERVLYFEHLTPEKIEEIQKEYGSGINADDSFWRKKASANYATLMFVKNPHLVEPIKVYKKDKSAFKSFQCLNNDLLMVKRQIVKHPHDCDRNKHYFVFQNNKSVCLYCGFEFPYAKEMEGRPVYKRIKEMMELSKWNEEWFHAELDNVANAHKEKQKDEIRNRLLASVGKLYSNDGRQTPYYENPIYYAQHALGCCCRKCLLKFYGIPAERELSEEEVNYFTDLIYEFILEK